MSNKLLDKFKNNNGLVNALFIYILANGIGQGTTLLTNIFFTRFMTKADYGMYSNYYAYVALLSPFVGIDLYFGLANAYIDYKQDIYKFRSSVLLLSLFGLFTSGTVMVGLKFFNLISIDYNVILFLMLHAFGFFLVNYYIQSMNMENRYIAKGAMMAVPNLLQAGFAVVALFICNSYFSRVIGASVAVFACGIVAAVLIIAKAKPVYNGEYWKYALKISVPAIIGSVSSMIMQQCDNVMITEMIDAEATAVYSLIFYVGYILMAVSQATSGVWQVWIFNALSKRAYKKIPVVQKWYTLFMLFLATGLYMIAPEIIKILSPRDYWHFEYVSPFVVGSFMMIMYTTHISVIEYEKKTVVSSSIVAIAAGFNIILNSILIREIGALGASFASVASYFLIWIMSGLYLQRKGKYYFRLRTYLINICAILALATLFYFVREQIIIRYAVFMVILLAELFVFWRKKDELFAIFKNKDNFFSQE